MLQFRGGARVVSHLEVDIKISHEIQLPICVCILAAGNTRIPIAKS